MKRHEATVRHLEHQWNRAKLSHEEAAAEVAYHWHRGLITREEMGELISGAEALEENYYEAFTRAVMAEQNLRRSHVAYCRARSLEAKCLREAKRTEQLHSLISREDSQQISLAPMLERLAYSLTTHGPPPGTASKHGASRVIT